MNTTSSSPGPGRVGERVRLELAEGLAVDWELDVLMRAADTAGPDAAPAWELLGRPDWGRLDSLRLIVAAVGDTALAMAVARPAGAGDHSRDELALAVVDGEVAELAQEALLSTEYDRGGRVRRLGVEAWLEGGSGKRIAADRTGEVATVPAGALVREVTPLAVRLDGERGSGLHELLRPA